jgi:hypothetical protein
MLGLDDAGNTCDGHASQKVPPAQIGFRAQLSRAQRQAKRPSQPQRILESIQTDARGFYSVDRPRRKNLAYVSPSSTNLDGSPRPSRNLQRPHLEPSPDEDMVRQQVTLYSLLSRHIRDVTMAQGADCPLNLDATETSLLHSHGYSASDLERWSSCVLNVKSVAAVAIFKDGDRFPPFFLVLLFLRRRHIKMSALGIVMRHVAARNFSEPLAWNALLILVIRLLRHARVVWPESIPWIASLFSTEATRIVEDATRKGRFPPKLRQAITHFSNTLLSLIALPTSLHPLLYATHQEKAQFQVLRFMQSCDPAIVVMRTGFRAVTRNQLMHPKTAQEMEWATLKGPSWPPWKEARTAMDEEKGYEFGASRASQILHRMYEAGYGGQTWEQKAEIYAGWDTDMSPTIQTRTSLPQFSTQYRDEPKVQALLWAGRIRATRSKREAWACFLACEASDNPVPSEVYFAMFEKLHYPEIDMYDHTEHDESEHGEAERRNLLAGDMKEVQPDPRSPLHLVHISEPVPIYEQLFHRMSAAKVPLSSRLLAFFMETHPDFDVVLKLLETHRVRFNNGVHKLIRGPLQESPESPVPGYFLGAFVTFLCRFGRFSHVPTTTAVTKPIDTLPGVHELRIKTDRHYLLEYAFTLLMHYRPEYRPAWTAYMEAVVSHSFIREDRSLRRVSPVDSQYGIMCGLFEALQATDLDPDDEQFRLLCTTARSAVHAVYNGEFAVRDSQHILSTAPRLLRTVFRTLVAANVDPNAASPLKTTIPPHVPGPAVLHAYVRALGILRDYEGLYSFSTWAVNNHAEISARANSQRSGAQALYRTFVALRAALAGSLDGNYEGAPEDLTELVREQLESVEEWGWPPDEHVDMYLKNTLRGARAPRGA